MYAQAREKASERGIEEASKIDITQITLNQAAGRARMSISNNIGLFGENVGLFWENEGLFWENIRLFWENIGLFWENIGLFWENIGLFQI